MQRDFSESAKQKLLEYVKDATETTVWGKIGDIIGDIGLTIQQWIGTLNISGYINNLDEYHKKVIDKNDTTSQRIEEIFTNVKNIDIRYQSGLQQNVNFSESVINFINNLAETIDPNGGNMDMQQMSATLSASLAKIEEAKVVKDKTIEDNMLGTDPNAVEMSADPVNLSTGNFVYDHEDLAIGGEIPLSFHRYYNSKDSRVGTLGKCFLHNYDIAIEGKEDGEVGVRFSDGQLHHFEKTSDGRYVGKTIAIEDLEKTETGFTLITLGKERTFFDLNGKLLRQENWFGRGITFTYNESGLLAEAITDTNSKLMYSYDENHMLTLVSDHTGRTVELSYENGNLSKAVMATGAVYNYAYGINGRIKEVVNAREVVAVINKYDNKYRVTKQTFPDGGTMLFEYDDVNKRVTMTERNGVKTTYVHDENYRNVETIYSDGTSEKFVYNEKNLCISQTDRNGHTSRMAYDNRGNVTQVVDALKKRTNYTYDANNNLIAISVNGKERLKNHYDASGKLISTENLDGENVWIIYDEQAHPVEILQADGSKVALTYDVNGNVCKIKDAYGIETSYRYDVLNRVIRTIDGNGNDSNYEYDKANRITKVTNAEGNNRTYKYNASGRVEKIVDFDGYALHFSYNTVGKVESTIDKENHTTTYTYDKMWNLILQTMPNGAVLSNVYDENNRIKEVGLPLGGTILYEYDAVGNKISETDAVGNKTAFVYDAANQLIERIEPDGAKTEFKYDREGNLITVINALGFETSYTYDVSGRRTSMTDAEGNTTSVSYNNMGKVERICYANDSQTIYTYEKGGRLQRVENPDGSTEEYTYDKKGNLLTRINGVGDIISFEYDKLNRIVGIINQLGGKRSFSYDAVGHVTNITDEKGNQTNYEYSPNGNLLKVTDALGNETFYEYDVMGNLTKTVCTGVNGEEAQNTSFDWDLEGHVTSVTDPLGAIESYTYDKNGNMVSKKDKDGYLTQFTYGLSGKLEEVSYADGQTVTLSYDALRRLQEVKDMLGTTSITMDKMGRTLSVTDSYGKTTGYEWGTMGEKLAVIYPDGKRAEYEYNQAMQLVALHTGSDTVRYTYDKIGRINKKMLPNGVGTTYHYNAFGRVDEIVHKGESISESYKYTFDIYGNKIGAEKNRAGVDVDNGLFTYAYDELSRLTEVHQNNVLLRKYSYDAFGNRTQKRDYSTGTENVTNYVYNINNQLVSEADAVILKTYNYDHRGNLINMKSNDEVLKTFTFDATNRMIASMGIVDDVWENATYAYNGLGHRMEQNIYTEMLPGNPKKKTQYTIDMTRQYYNLLQTNSGERDSQTYYWDGNVATMEVYGEGKYYLQDDLGSPMQLLNADGMSHEVFAYDEFGFALVEQPQNRQAFGFTGYQMDEAGGLYFAQARRYDAQSGRFVSEDKVRGFAVLPYTLNHYTHCWGNPENFVDVDGNLPMPISVGLDVIEDNFSSPSSVGSTVIDGIYSSVEVLAERNTHMPEFRTYFNSKGTKMVSISNSANYHGGRGGVRSVSEAKLLNPDTSASNYAAYEKLGKAYKWNKGLKVANKVIVGIGGVVAFYNEYQASEGLETEDRIINGAVEAAWSIGSAVAIGALVGSIVPGAGTVAGAAIGFLVGAVASLAADILVHAKFFSNNTKSIMDFVKKGLNCAWDAGQSVVEELFTTGIEFLDGIGREKNQSYCISAT